MKKKSLSLIGILLFSALSCGIYTSCDEDTTSKLEVTVVDPLGKTVPNTMVVIGAKGATIRDTGYTDGAGMYKTEFGAPAIFEVYSKLYIPDSTLNSLGILIYIDGTANVRLKEGESESVTVRLGEERKQEQIERS